MASFADQIDCPVIFPLPEVAEVERDEFRPPQPTAEEERNDGRIALLPKGYPP